jgi:hypothetical protein
MIEDDPADTLCDLLAARFGRPLPLEVQAHVIAARTAAKWLAYVEANSLRPIPGREGARLGLQRFFSFAVVVFEGMSGQRAALTWRRDARAVAAGKAFSGRFFEVADLFQNVLLDEKFRLSNAALGKVLDRLLKRRGEGAILARGRAGRPKQSNLA